MPSRCLLTPAPSRAVLSPCSVRRQLWMRSLDGEEAHRSSNSQTPGSSLTLEPPRPRGLGGASRLPSPHGTPRFPSGRRAVLSPAAWPHCAPGAPRTSWAQHSVPGPGGHLTMVVGGRPREVHPEETASQAGPLSRLPTIRIKASIITGALSERQEDRMVWRGSPGRFLHQV